LSERGIARDFKTEHVPISSSHMPCHIINHSTKRWFITVVLPAIDLSSYITCRSIAHWIGLCVVLHPRQHSIGYMGDGFYRSKDSTNSIKVLKEKAKENNPVLHIRYFFYAALHYKQMRLSVCPSVRSFTSHFYFRRVIPRDLIVDPLHPVDATMTSSVVWCTAPLSAYSFFFCIRTSITPWPRHIRPVIVLSSAWRVRHNTAGLLITPLSAFI